jgi:hypothetical protein
VCVGKDRLRPGGTTISQHRNRGLPLPSEHCLGAGASYSLAIPTDPSETITVSLTKKVIHQWNIIQS